MWAQLCIDVQEPWWDRERCSFPNAAMEKLQQQISELLLHLSLWHYHLHYLTQSVFAFALTTTQASQLLSHFSQGVESFSDFSDCRASSYVNHREKQLFLQRKAILPFLFILHYIWTFLFLHYIHVAFTQARKKNSPRVSGIKKKKKFFDFGVRAWHGAT